MRHLLWLFVRRWIRRSFPNVRHMSVETLAGWLASSDAPPVLLDTRTQHEFDVSHLPGAYRVESDVTRSDIAGTIDQTRTVVTYCSIGYRSARAAQQLSEMGFEDVYNLEGSIFQWAHRGHALVRDGSPVHEVHPFDRTWGLLLRRDLHYGRRT